MQYCTNCGHKIDSGAKFCPNCGYEVNKPIQQYQAAKPAATSSSALVFGILGIVFVFIFILGFIFSLLAVVLSNNPNQSNTTAAKTLGWIGIVISAIPLIIILILVIIFASGGADPTTALVLLDMF